MKKQYIYLLVIIWGALQGRALAQEKYLDVFMTNTNRSAVSGISITCTGGCSTELVNQGRARIALPAQTRPNDTIILRLVRRSLRNPEWVIVTPPDGAVVVPAFSNLGVASISVMVTIKGDRQTLNNDKAVRTIVENTLKKVRALDGQLSEQEFDLALKMQAKAYGLTPEEVANAIKEWAARAKDPYDRGLAALLNKNYAEATKQLTTSYEIRRKGIEGYLDTAYFLGRSLWEEGKYVEAVEKLQEVAAFRKDDAVVLNMLGVGLTSINDYPQAEVILRRALASSKQEYGEESRTTAIVLSHLGSACRLQNKLSEAEELSIKALTIIRRELGDDDSNTAMALNNLAHVFRDQSKYDKAEPLYKEALAIQEKKLGKGHRDTAIEIDNIGVLYDRQGKHKEAEPLLKRALDIKERTFGFEHPLTANSYANLGDNYNARGMYAESVIMYEKWLAIAEKLPGNKLQSLSRLNSLGVVYHRQGKYAEAESYYKRYIDICAKSDPDVCFMTYRNLGKLYTAQGKYVEAEQLFQRSLTIFGKRPDTIFGKHPDLQVRVVFVLESYAELLRKTNREAEAEALEARAKEIRAQAGFYGKN